MRRLIRHISGFRRREDGVSTVEFVILFPIFMTLLLSGYEIGVLMSRQTMLDRGVDLAVRDLRLGRMDGGEDDVLDESDVRRAVCNYAGVLKECLTALHIDLQPISTSSFEMPATSATCVDRSEELRPAVVFDPGVENELMFVRACFVVDPMFPGTGLGAQLPKDATGGYQLVATSAFVNEPL